MGALLLITALGCADDPVEQAPTSTSDVSLPDVSLPDIGADDISIADDTFVPDLDVSEDTRQHWDVEPSQDVRDEDVRDEDVRGEDVREDAGTTDPDTHVQDTSEPDVDHDAGTDAGDLDATTDVSEVDAADDVFDLDVVDQDALDHDALDQDALDHDIVDQDALDHDIVDHDVEDAGPPAISFSVVYANAVPSTCKNCHGQNDSRGLRLHTEESAYTSLVNVNANCAGGGVRVVPNDPEASLFWTKVAPNVATCGGKMGNLTQTQADLIYDWIAGGALP